LAFERRQGKIQFNSKDRGFRTRTGQAPEPGAGCRGMTFWRRRPKRQGGKPMASALPTLNGFLGGPSGSFQPIVAAWQRTAERAPVQAPTACRRRI
jgi:hypothetical protein